MLLLHKPPNSVSSCRWDYRIMNLWNILLYFSMCQCIIINFGFVLGKLCCGAQNVSENDIVPHREIFALCDECRKTKSIKNE